MLYVLMCARKEHQTSCTLLQHFIKTVASKFLQPIFQLDSLQDTKRVILKVQGPIYMLDFTYYKTNRQHPK